MHRRNWGGRFLSLCEEGVCGRVISCSSGVQGGDSAENETWTLESSDH